MMNYISICLTSFPACCIRVCKLPSLAVRPVLFSWFLLGFRKQGEGIALVYLKLKALCSLTKCFIVIGLIRFLLSSWRCYHRLEAVVGNQSSPAQTLSRWDQLTVIWFQNTLPEEAPGREWSLRCEPGAGGLCCSLVPSS